MDSISKERKIVFRNYSNVGKRKDDTTVEEYEVILNSQDDAEVAEMPIMKTYGLYSVLVDEELAKEHFSISLVWKNVEKEECQTAEIVNSLQVSQAERVCDPREFFSNYQSGFVFAKLTKQSEEQIHIRLKTKEQIYESAAICLSADEGTDDSAEKELMNMVQVIYEEQPLLLLSVFQKAPLSVFLDKESNIKDSIETKLKLIEQCTKVYREQELAIRQARKFKLKTHQYIDRIDKLTNVSAKTINYMSQNPQYLIEMKKKKGIKYDGKYYLPEKTLVCKNVVDYDIYENRYMVSFLKMLLLECEKLKMQVKLLQDNAIQWHKNATTNSQRADFEALIQRCRQQGSNICKYEKELKRNFTIYKTIFCLDKAKDISGLIKKPRVSAIFRQLPEYNRLFTGAFMPWFNAGLKPLGSEVPDKVDTFVTAVSNPSTTYELYIVVKWIEFFRENGYELDYRKAKFAGVHEKESRYSDDAYEFVFYKEDTFNGATKREEITLFYSPSVYIPIPNSKITEMKAWKYNIHEKNVDDILFRRTKKSNVSREDNESNGKGAHYEPDFILKYRQGIYSDGSFQNGSVIRYLMADAKHKDYEIVWKKDMPDLLYKYINSIKARHVNGIDIKVAGLCAIYHAHSYDEDGEIIDETDYFEYDDAVDSEEPFAKMLYMNVEDTGDYWKADFIKMLDCVRCVI